MMDKNNSDNPIFNELLKGIFKAIWDFMIQQAGEQAEEESRKKSQRIKLAVRKVDGKKSVSYKGNKWGRKSISKKVDEEIIKLFKEDKTYREICQTVFYWNKNNHKKFVSMGYVSGVINGEKNELENN
jgi:DNA invertase Pin-like site-specific DNA recombinase